MDVSSMADAVGHVSVTNPVCPRSGSPEPTSAPATATHMTRNLAPHWVQLGADCAPRRRESSELAKLNSLHGDVSTLECRYVAF